MLLTWGIVRIPLLLLAVYLLRYEIVVLGEEARLFDADSMFITVSVIDLVSTPAARVLCFVSLAIILLLWLILAARFESRTAYFSSLFVAAALILSLFHATATPLWRVIPPVLVLATNLVPDSWLNRLLARRRWWNAFMAAGVGVAELFFFNRFVRWLRERSMGQRAVAAFSARWSTVPGALFASAVAAALVSNGYLWSDSPDRMGGGATWLRQIEQALRMSPAAQVRVAGDIHAVELDATGRFVFLAGHGFSHLRRYDLADWSAPPALSSVPTGFAQGFAYDAVGGELYVYDWENRQLLYIDAGTLKLKRSVPFPSLPPGDISMVVDHRTDTIVIASEDDEDTGSAIQILSRKTGQVLATRDEDTAILLLHPRKAVVYMSFFGRHGLIQTLDLRRLDVVRQQSARNHMEGMAFWEASNELLVTAPLESRILRFDADTLDYKGYFNATFGVRSIALDRRRNLLVCAGLASGMAVVVDLVTGEQKASYYLGPWLRMIAISEERGAAYISSFGALYELDYLHAVAGTVR